MPRGGSAPRKPSAPTGCSSPPNGTFYRSLASTPAITTGTARTNPASSGHPAETTKSAFHLTCRSGGGKARWPDQRVLPSGLADRMRSQVRTRACGFEAVQASVPHPLASLGLADVGGEGRVVFGRGGSPAVRVIEAGLRQVGDQMIAAGLVGRCTLE